MSTDSRTIFTPSSASILTLTNNEVTVQELTTAEIFVTASFGSYSDLTGQISFSIAQMANLTLVSNAYPVCGTSGCFDKTVLRPVQSNNGAYQRVQLVASATDSIGNTFGIDMDETMIITFNDTSTLTAISETLCEVNATVETSNLCVI
jgi:hypothetical protein